MDSAELNEIKGTQSWAIRESYNFFGENLMKSKAHTPSHDSDNFFGKNLMVRVEKDCGVGRVYGWEKI